MELLLNIHFGQKASRRAKEMTPSVVCGMSQARVQTRGAPPATNTSYHAHVLGVPVRKGLEAGL